MILWSFLWDLNLQEGDHAVFLENVLKIESGWPIEGGPCASKESCSVICMMERI
jgi:hypothetical protein